MRNPDPPNYFASKYSLPHAAAAMVASSSARSGFLTKPFRDQDLLDAVQQGLARDHAWLENEKATATLRARFETLTLREREVMALVVTGRLNKQIAYDIGISEIAVKASCGQVMRKMNAASLPDLARMADKLNLTEESPRAVSQRMSWARRSVFIPRLIPRPIPAQFSRRSAAASGNPKAIFTIRKQRLLEAAAPRL
jgi:DNA-binding CsgD family transcriptional regulator